ncbi:MAG: single-stranded DNA-binding protein [Prosthecobacter sp.]|jgi:single-strand DNA-binding protein|uniref:single-stranded DNA-binding protein n=1 Tax=Prosthecobacter sp. TaxID=1965333 RepID=UPI001A063AEE|nr:single-stranded DNA-binding protein [Prosthecobacter sp.]MBE2285531.1 single-stranded DNA-binding protein [Prosthecobacter sp.]
MASFNKVMLIGNLTRDPEVRYTPKGSAVCDIGLAVNRVYSSESGEKVEEVTFVDVVLWSKLAELAGKYLHKGRPVFIEGRLQMDSWEDKQTGQKRTRLRVVGEQMQFLGSPQGGERSGGGGGDDEGGYSGGGGGGGGGYNRPQQRPQQRPAPQQRPQQRPAPAQQNDDFGEGPITDGMEDDDIPF